MLICFNMKRVAIIVGGKGIRMKSEIPKQFLLKNKPILIHTIESFIHFDERILVAKISIEYWNKLCLKTISNYHTKLLRWKY